MSLEEMVKSELYRVGLPFLEPKLVMLCTRGFALHGTKLRSRVVHTFHHDASPNP